MKYPELINYIKEKLRKGTPYHHVKKHLLHHGWRHIDIYHNASVAKKIVAKEKKLLSISLIMILSLLLVGVSLQFSPTQTITGYQILETTADDKSPYVAFINDVTMTEAHIHSFVVEAGDTDGEDLSFTLTQDSPEWASIETLDATTGSGNATGNVTLSPPDGTVTTDTATVVVTSTSNDTDSRSFSIQVDDNNAPSFSGPIPNETWSEDNDNTNINLSEYFSDVENDTLTYTVLTAPSNVTVTINDTTTIVTLSPDANHNGFTSIQFTADDGIDTTNSNLIYLNITPVQDVPEISPINITPASAYINSNLSCAFFVIEHDNENTTANVSWYKYNSTSGGWDFQQGEAGINCTPNSYCYSLNNISYSLTNYSEIWNCTTFLNDSIDLSVLYSSQVTISNAPPFITDVADNSNQSNIIVTGDNLTVDVTWYELDGDNATIYVCDTAEANVTAGCLNNELCSVHNDSSSPSSCNYSVQITGSFQNNYSVFGCDSTSCSAPYNDSYYLNRPPEINRSSTTLALHQGRIGCSGNCSISADNQQTFWKFNDSITTSPDTVAIENLTLVTTISAISGNWSGNVVVYRLNTTTGWNESSSGTDLDSILTRDSVSFTNITSTGSHNFNITPLKGIYLSEDYFSLKIVNPESNTVSLDNASSAGSYFPVGNNLSNNTAGEIQFSTSPTIFVEYNHSIPNQSWYMNVPAPTLDLDDYFFDPDGDTINYSIAEDPDHISVTINSISHVVSFYADYGWYGTEYVVFNATDSKGASTLSNRVALSVLYVEGIGDQQTTTTISGGSSSTEVASLDVYIDDVYTTPTNVISVPFTLKNSGATDLNGINLSTFFDVEGLIVMFDEASYLSGLAVGEYYNSSLTLVTKDVSAGNYSVEFIADVTNPKLVQTSTIYIHVGLQELANESIQKQIEFAEDLFRTNPECLELMESIFRAKGLVKEGRISRARELLDTAIEDCRELISQREETILDLRDILADNWKLLLLIVIVLFIIYLAIIVLFKY